MRRATSIFVGLLASLLLVASIGIALEVPSQVEKDKAYYREFQRVSAIVADYESENGRLPDGDAFSRLASGTDMIGLFKSPAGRDRCDGFMEADSDSFVLKSWRGDWFECFAYPSGRSTLAVSPKDIMFGWGSQVAVGLVLCIAGFWAALFLWTRPRFIITGPRSNSSAR